MSIDHFFTEGEWIVQVASPGYIPYLQGVTIPYKGIIKIPLQPRQAHLKGRILDGVTKRALEGVEVDLIGETVKAKDAESGYGFNGKEYDLTDSQGMFELGPLAGLGYETTILIGKGGYISKTVVIKPDEPWKDELGDISLTPFSKIQGRLIGSKGTPLKDHFVYIVHESIPYLDPEAVAKALVISPKGNMFAMRGVEALGPSAGRGETNDEGMFSMELLEGGKYTLVFGDLKANVQEIQVRNGEVKTVTLRKR